jgi:quercetin dioxygenase-like cupin family protein
VELQGKSATMKGPSEWFAGDVWIDFIAQGHGSDPLSVGIVHFSPGARTAWHSHSLGQTLWVTEGQGLVQSRGEPVAAISPGDVVFTPAREWHWHGAAADHFMTHLSVAEGEPEWGEHVTDAEYRARG